jgi:transposase
MAKAPETPVSRVEVITTVQRRRRWTTAGKVRFVEEASRPGMSVSYQRSYRLTHEGFL